MSLSVSKEEQFFYIVNDNQLINIYSVENVYCEMGRLSFRMTEENSNHGYHWVELLAYSDK